MARHSLSNEPPSAMGGKRRILVRYLLFQVPSWCLAGACLAFAQSLDWLSSPWPLVLFGGLVAKDLALYPWLRIAYEPSTLHGPEALTDAVAIVETPLTPEGRVRLGAERWRARRVSESVPANAGDRVRVRRVEGLLLLVDPLDPEV